MQKTQPSASFINQIIDHWMLIVCRVTAELQLDIYCVIQLCTSVNKGPFHSSGQKGCIKEILLLRRT